MTNFGHHCDHVCTMGGTNILRLEQGEIENLPSPCRECVLEVLNAVDRKKDHPGCEICENCSGIGTYCEECDPMEMCRMGEMDIDDPEFNDLYGWLIQPCLRCITIRAEHLIDLISTKMYELEPTVVKYANAVKDEESYQWTCQYINSLVENGLIPETFGSTYKEIAAFVLERACRVEHDELEHACRVEHDAEYPLRNFSLEDLMSDFSEEEAPF